MENISNSKTIYLHIGMPKSGSSSIQVFLYENREKLQKFDIFYPVISIDKDNPDYRTYTVMNYRKIIEKILPKGPGEYNKFFENNFLNQINNSNCSKIILSEELIFLNNNVDIVNIMLQHGFNVKVIVYIRKPVEYLTSFWQEHFKPYTINYNFSVEEFANQAKINYDLILAFIKKLGKDNVLIRPFDKKEWKNNNLIEDFLNILKVENFEDASYFQRVNSSYNRNLCEFMRIIKNLNLEQEQFKEIIYDYTLSIVPEEEKEQIDKNNLVKITHIIENNINPEPKIVDTISDELTENIVEKYTSVLDEIAQVYGREKLFNSYYPQNYKQNNSEKYTEVKFSLKQTELINKAIKFSKQNNMKNKKQKNSIFKKAKNFIKKKFNR